MSNFINPESLFPEDQVFEMEGRFEAIIRDHNEEEVDRMVGTPADWRRIANRPFDWDRDLREDWLQ